MQSLASAPPEDSYEALPAQQGLIFHGLLAPDAGIDLVQVVIDLPGPLRRKEFQRAWQRAAGRHAALRTGFRWRDGAQPDQVVHNEVPFDVAWHADPGAEDVQRYIDTDRARGFDPRQPPLVRVAVFRHAPDRHTAVVTLHHAVLDGRALQMVLHEVFTDYDATCAGRSATFPTLRPYRDFAVWWARRDTAEDEAFWTANLRDRVTPTPLGVARGGGAAGSSTVETTLTDRASAALRSRAEAIGATANTLVLAAWAALLSGYSGQDDVVMGTIRSCRHGSVDGADGMVGMMINVLPLRVRVDPRARLTDWLTAVRRQALAVREHRFAPLAAIRGWCGTPSGVPLFESVVAYEHEALDAGLRRLDPAWRHRTISVLRHPSNPVTLYAFGEPRFRLQLIAHRGWSDEAEATSLLDRVADLLTAIATAPADQPVGELPILGGVERDTLLRDWSGAGAGTVRVAGSTVPQWFARQVARNPDATAVVAGDATLTYGELAARANALAHLLRRHGVGADDRVAVAVPRSAQLVVALLGILVAGAAYVPLDPANPPARNALILADSGVTVLLTTTGQDLAPARDGITVLALDQLVDVLATLPADPPPCPATPDSLAYVSYTSGSTGTPKGVAIPHRAVIRLVDRQAFAGFGPGETLLQLAPVAFDASTLELWASLLTGARLVVAPPGQVDPGTLATLLRDHQVTTLWLTAGLFHQIVEHDAHALDGVRQLLAGGDVLAPDAVRAAIRARGGSPVVNGYGPTENTTFTCCHVMTDAAQVADPVPIGRPISGTTVYVLDTRLRPVPTGVAGELYTGGSGVARGYVGRPDLTAERFVADPFATCPGARLYRTGDRVRWRADGVLEFLGRLDDQTKIRGFRTEPGEAEAVLRHHPDVVDAVAVVRGERSRQLAAYVVPRANTVDLAELRRHMAAALPDHLRPATYTVLDRLPLTANGKVDRAALPAPAPPAPRGMRPLAGGTQERLAELWSALLDTGPVGPDDNFFALGGDSLSAIRLAFGVKEVFGVDLPIGMLFSTSTLAEHATAIDAHRPGSAAAAIPRSPRRALPDPDQHAFLADGWEAWRWVGLRSSGFPVGQVLDLANPACAELADEVLSAQEQAHSARSELTYQLRQVQRPVRPRHVREIVDGAAAPPALDPGVVAAARTTARQVGTATAAYGLSFVDARRRLAGRLRTAAADPRFREALAWQNPHALRTAADPVASGDPGLVTTSSRHRQHEALVANYLQRYCAKNDTIGFFGPVGWARITGQTEPILVTPGTDLLATRTVYFEDWCVGALAGTLAEDRSLAPWLVPRRMPFLDVVDGWLHLPLAPPERLDSRTAAVFEACDGARTAAQVAAAVPAEPAEVFAVLEELRAAGRIAWTLEAPSDEMFPERALRQVLDRVDDDALRRPALRVLDKLEESRSAIAAAAGDPDRLIAAVGALETTFTGITGLPATRRDGRSSAGRTLVYEDCRRDVEVTLGPALLDSLGPPLALLLDSARWFTYAGAALFRRACARIFTERASRAGRAELPFADFWLWVNTMLLDPACPLVAPVRRGLQDRWARILAAPAGQSRIARTAEELRVPVREAFAAPRPGWPGGIHHSPDVMLAARSVSDIRAGRFQWVVGELHPGTNTLGSGLFVAQHPAPDDLRRSSARDLPSPRVSLAASRHELGAPVRITNMLYRPDDLRLVFASDTCGLDPAHVLPIGSCVLVETAGRLVVRTRDGRHRFDLVDVLGELLMLHLLQHFEILPPAAHTPRLTVDRVVLARESWTFDAAALGFAMERDEADRFLCARRWRREHGLPRFVFVRTAAEPKPFFVDLASLASVDLLARAARRAGSAQLTVTEMLPGPDETWLTDTAGERYTAELRLVAVDARHAG